MLSRNGKTYRYANEHKRGKTVLKRSAKLQNTEYPVLKFTSLEVSAYQQLPAFD